MKCRKKAIVVDAIQFTEQNIEELLQVIDRINLNYLYRRNKKNDTLEKYLVSATITNETGQNIAYLCDYIIKDEFGQISVIAFDTFEKFYEVIE